MTDPRTLVLDIINARHDSDAVVEVLQDRVQSGDDIRDVMTDVITAHIAISQVLHQLCHMDPKIDQLLDTVVAGGPSALNASISESVPLDDFLSEPFTRRVFDDFTHGTDPDDRTWAVDTLPNGQTVITLEGTGIRRRVFAPVGASEEDINAFHAIMQDYEATQK